MMWSMMREDLHDDGWESSPQLRRHAYNLQCPYQHYDYTAFYRTHDDCDAAQMALVEVKEKYGIDLEDVFVAKEEFLARWDARNRMEEWFTV
jgi:hypothetical protein